MKTMKIILPALGALICSGCLKDTGSNKIALPTKGIRFITAEYNATTTRSSEENGPGERLFIGMAGTDSLFLCASETAMETKPTLTTKGESAYVPESFHISAFKDSESAPYLNLKLASNNGWDTYSPMMYWPAEYDVLHFFAWEYNLGDNPISPAFTTGDPFKAEFDYTAPHSDDDNDGEAQPDISMAISLSQDESSEPVELDFYHTLSAVEFRIGDIGDAEAVSASAQLTGILSEGRCTITAPVSPESIQWSHTGERDSYTQTIKDGVPFMLIPQVLTGTDAAFRIAITIGDIIHEFPAKKLSEITPEWKPNRKYTYTVNKGGEVKVDVRDNHTNTVKNNAKIQNTGFSTAYIRAAIVGYWYVMNGGVEEIAATWNIDDTAVGTLVKAADWESHWKEVDGIYYHLDPVSPGAYTAPLFDSYVLTKTTGPVSGSKLKINIAAQAVEKDKAAEFWPAEQ